MAIQFLNTVAVDTSVLYVDTASNRVGIGETSPDRLLHLKSSLPAVRLEDSDVSGLYHEFFASTSGLFQFKADGGNVQANSGFMFQVDNSERMRINSSGSVGIGTTNPGGLLHVSSGTSGDAVVIIESDTDNSNENDNPHVELRQDGGGIKAKLGIEGNAGNTYSNSLSNATYLGTVFEQSLQFITGNTGGVQTAKMTIQPNTGNIGIGTTSPSAKLEVKGSGDGDLFIGRHSSNASKLIYGYQSGSDGFLELRTGADAIVTKLSGYTGTPSYFKSNVGIGTSTPTAGVELSIQGSSPQIDFINSSSTDVHASIEAESDTGTGGKLIFKTKRNANTPTDKLVIREDGAIQQGNSSATGQFAAAFGQNNTASSLDAFATGELNTSSGRQSFTAGFDNLASGNASFAVGGGTTASGENSFAANGTTVASGISSSAFGAFSEATATNAFATGGDTTASGESSFSTGVTTNARGLASIASGQSCNTAVSANGSFAGGTVSNANAQFSIAYGDVATSSGRASQALGYIVNATGQYSFAQGFNNAVYGTASAVFGQQNQSSSTAFWSLSTGFLNTTRDSASLTVGSFNGMTASIASREQFMLGRYLNVPRDSSGNPSAGCLVVGEHNAYSNRPNVKFAVGTGVGVGAEADSFTVLKDGNVLMEQIVNKNYSSDSAAASGGVPVGGIYHNSGDLKIRLT